jgi:hypothetical protein
LFVVGFFAVGGGARPPRPAAGACLHAALHWPGDVVDRLTR